jgi:hypothetical protein
MLGRGAVPTLVTLAACVRRGVAGGYALRGRRLPQEGLLRRPVSGLWSTTRI